MAKQERIREGQLIYAKDEGRTEGRAEGRVEVARRMKSERLDTVLISKVTGLSATEIEKL
jgi:predicted transposase YdaD